MTAVGRFLRRKMLDDLPRLWNILQGSTWPVGPKPEVPVFKSTFSRPQPQSLNARPGIN